MACPSQSLNGRQAGGSELRTDSEPLTESRVLLRTCTLADFVCPHFSQDFRSPFDAQSP